MEKGLRRDLKVVQELAEHAVRRYHTKDEKSIPNRGGSVCTDVVVTQSVGWGWWWNWRRKQGPDLSGLVRRVKLCSLNSAVSGSTVSFRLVYKKIHEFMNAGEICHTNCQIQGQISILWLCWNFRFFFLSRKTIKTKKFSWPSLRILSTQTSSLSPQCYHLCMSIQSDYPDLCSKDKLKQRKIHQWERKGNWAVLN